MAVILKLCDHAPSARAERQKPGASAGPGRILILPCVRRERFQGEPAERPHAGDGRQAAACQ